MEDAVLAHLHTVARLCLQLSEAALAPGGVLVVDEVSSSPPATARRWPPAAWSSRSSAVGAQGRMASTTLTVNRRQRYPAERRALERFRSTGPRGTLSSGPPAISREL